MLNRGIQFLDRLRRKAPSRQTPKQPPFFFRNDKAEGNREKALQQLERILTASPQRKMFEKFFLTKYGIGRISYEAILNNIHKIVRDLTESELTIGLLSGLAEDLLRVQDNYLGTSEAIEKVWFKFSQAERERVLIELGKFINLDSGLGLRVLLKNKQKLLSSVAHYLRQYAPQIAERLKEVPETSLINELLRVRNELNYAAKNQQPLVVDEATIKSEETRTIRRQRGPEVEQTGVWVGNAMSHMDTFSQHYEDEMQTFAGQGAVGVAVPEIKTWRKGETGIHTDMFSRHYDEMRTFAGRMQATDIRNIEPGQAFYVGDRLYGIREDHGRFFLWQGASSVQEEIRVPGRGDIASWVDFNEQGLSFFIARDEDTLSFLLTCRSMLNNDTGEIPYPFAQAV